MKPGQTNSGAPPQAIAEAARAPQGDPWTTRLRAIAEAARAPQEDPWVSPLRKLKGRVGSDGVERLSTHDVFDILEVPMRRRPSQTVRLSRVMRGLGWTSIRARGLNPGSYCDRVRGYAREPKLPTPV